MDARVHNLREYFAVPQPAASLLGAHAGVVGIRVAIVGDEAQFCLHIVDGACFKVFCDDEAKHAAEHCIAVEVLRFGFI